MLEQIAQLCFDLDCTFSINSYMNDCKLIRFKWSVGTEIKVQSRTASEFLTLDDCLFSCFAWLESIK